MLSNCALEPVARKTMKGGDEGASVVGAAVALLAHSQTTIVENAVTLLGNLCSAPPPRPCPGTACRRLALDP